MLRLQDRLRGDPVLPQKKVPMVILRRTLAFRRTPLKKETDAGTARMMMMCHCPKLFTFNLSSMQGRVRPAHLVTLQYLPPPLPAGDSSVISLPWMSGCCG